MISTREEKIVITAGYSKSPYVLELINHLTSGGKKITGIIVVSPLNYKRLRTLLLKQGLNGLNAAVHKMFNPNTRKKKGPKAEFKSLKKWAKANKVEYRVVNNLNGKDVEGYLASIGKVLLLYGGGGIIRQNIICIDDLRILNAHLGLLPQIRGMNAAEWNILLNLPQTVTIHLIDEGIDTGNVIETVNYKIDDITTIDELRVRALEIGSKALANTVIKGSYEQEGISHEMISRQCFTLSGYMRHILSQKLR